MSRAKIWSYKFKDAGIFHHISNIFGAPSRKGWSWFGSPSEKMEWSQLGLVTDQNWEWFPKPEDGNLCCRICLGWDIRVLVVPTSAPSDVEWGVPAPLSHPKAGEQNPTIPVTSPGKNTTFHPNFRSLEVTPAGNFWVEESGFLPFLLVLYSLGDLTLEIHGLCCVSPPWIPCYFQNFL